MHRFEDLAQQLIENALARLLGEHLRPRDVLQALVRAIDDAGGKNPPNHFWVTLNSADLERLRDAEPRLADELAEQTRQIMLQMGLRLDIAPRVLLNGNEEIAMRQMRVSARWLPAAEVRPQPDQGALPRRPFLIVDGRRQVDLNAHTVAVGRSRSGDIVLDDRRVSRNHLELRWNDASARFLAVDLGSSGGTRVNGHAVKQCPLEAGDVISLGGYELIYGEEFELSSTSAFIRPEGGSTRTDADGGGVDSDSGS
jgi:hypothetical protein